MPVPGVATLFLLAGVAILVGYVGHWLFRKHRLSDVLILLGVGLAIGPWLGLVDAQALKPMLLVLAPFGLILVLFEGGLSLAWPELRAVGARALSVTLGTWILTAGLLWAIGTLGLGLAPHIALLLAVSIAGPGVTALLPLLPDIAPPPAARAMITIETTLGSLLNAVTTTAIVAVLLADTTAWGGAGIVASRFLVGAAAGVLVGFVWARLMHLVHGAGHTYGLTLGALVAAYVGTETLGGSGFLMALAFGLVLGNAAPLARDGGVRGVSGLAPDAHGHQAELIFLFRSVYFVAVGASLAPGALSPAFALGGLALAAGIFAVRLVTMGLAHGADVAGAKPERALMVSLVPRGLSTAIAASVPAAMGVAGAEVIVPHVLYVILAGGVVTTIGLRAYERARKSRTPAGAAVALAEVVR